MRTPSAIASKENDTKKTAPDRSEADFVPNLPGNQPDSSNKPQTRLERAPVLSVLVAQVPSWQNESSLPCRYGLSINDRTRQSAADRTENGWEWNNPMDGRIGSRERSGMIPGSSVKDLCAYGCTEEARHEYRGAGSVFAASMEAAWHFAP